MRLKLLLYEFHISREVREFYDIEETLFAQSGNVIFVNFYLARLLADKLNKKQNLAVGFIFAFVAGIGIAFAFEFFDNTIKTPEDVKAKLQLDTLIGIAKYPKKSVSK